MLCVLCAPVACNPNIATFDQVGALCTCLVFCFEVNTLGGFVRPEVLSLGTWLQHPVCPFELMAKMGGSNAVFAGIVLKTQFRCTVMAINSKGG